MYWFKKYIATIKVLTQGLWIAGNFTAKFCLVLFFNKMEPYACVMSSVSPDTVTCPQAPQVALWISKHLDLLLNCDYVKKTKDDDNNWLILSGKSNARHVPPLSSAFLGKLIDSLWAILNKYGCWTGGRGTIWGELSANRRYHLRQVYITKQGYTMGTSHGLAQPHPFLYPFVHF